MGDDLFANTLLALNAETGQRIWHFQAVKHDIWDRDFPSPPILLTVQARQESDRCRGSADEAGVALFVRSHERQTAVSD